MPHESPNNAESDSLVYKAETWYLAQGFSPIPDKRKHPHLYQGMLNEYYDQLD